MRCQVIKLHAVLALLIACWEMRTPAWGEKVDLLPADLRQTATHVITGEVIAIYDRPSDTKDWKYQHFLAEVRVTEVEKGDGLKPGSLIYVRYWKRHWNGAGPQPPSTIGHRGLPQERETLRIYLAKNAYDGFSQDNNDGGFNVIGANGFEALPMPENK